MTQLTLEETVWLQALCAAIARGEGSLIGTAESVVELFNNRFPPSPPPQKESVSGLAQDRREFWISGGYAFEDQHLAIINHSNGKPIHVTELRHGEVIVTREMMAKAMKEVWIIGDHESSERFNVVCKALGLKP